MSTAALAVVFLLSTIAPAGGGQAHDAPPASDRSYLGWTASQAQQVGARLRVNGRVGGMLDLRVLHTEHSYNYKLRATWMTPDAIRAAARLAQLAGGLSSQQTEALVAEAEGVGGTVLLVEIDPREGSGVIPLDWTAFLGPKGSRPGEPSMVVGVQRPALREMRALSGIFRRDYDYDLFWVVFPLVRDSGDALLPDAVTEAELVVRIYDKEGRVTWPVPAFIRPQPPPG